MSDYAEADYYRHLEAFGSCCEPDSFRCAKDDCDTEVIVEGETCPDCRRALQVIADAEQAAQILPSYHCGLCSQSFQSEWPVVRMHPRRDARFFVCPSCERTR